MRIFQSLCKTVNGKREKNINLYLKERIWSVCHNLTYVYNKYSKPNNNFM